ncbi:MAG: cyclic nucleotide-binding protein [Bacteroidales bacterium 43_36]|nr:MAG: cyclic nucleotide-binding protein [Bacteroidales bacterium 43_36]
MNSMKTPQEIAEMISKRFYPLPDADLDSLASIIESSKAAKGKLLLDNGQISKYLYYVESGLLRQFYYKNKRDITEHFSCEGNIVICIASTFQREPTRLLIEALEPTVYHRISFSEFSDLLKTSLAINRLYQKILEWALMLSQEKADSWRFESARKRYLRFQQEYPEAAKRASVNHIASYLLMTPESLSRVRAGVL